MLAAVAAGAGAQGRAMRCFRVTVEYDGTCFAGFQYQCGQRSVQDVLERALERLTGQFVRVHGAGRTDAGVHALGQVVSFHADTRIPLERLATALNSVLPDDVVAAGAEETSERFHARFSARSRAYLYAVLNRPQPSALLGRYSWHYPWPLDIGAMQDGASRLVGVHDYAAWANGTDEVRSTTRHVIRCAVRRTPRLVLVQVEANAFLRGMVRNMVGTLLEVGGGKRRPSEIDDITRSRERAKAGPTAPARGLCLMRVRY